LNSRTIENYIHRAVRSAIKHFKDVEVTPTVREAIRVNARKVLDDYMKDGRIMRYSEPEVSQNAETGLTEVVFAIQPMYAVEYVNISAGVGYEAREAPAEVRLSFEF
jgi:hypothetical protein